MRRSYPQMSPARTQRILDEARTAGSWGAPRLPASVHAVADELSDSMLVRALDEHAAGLAEHASKGAA